MTNHLGYISLCVFFDSHAGIFIDNRSYAATCTHLTSVTTFAVFQNEFSDILHLWFATATDVQTSSLSNSSPFVKPAADSDKDRHVSGAFIYF